MRRVLILAFVCALATSAFSVAKRDKKELAQQYQGKFLQVQKEGLAVGLCSAPMASAFGSPGASDPLAVRIDGDKADYHEQRGFGSMMASCLSTAPEPIHAGELLRVIRVLAHGDEIRLYVENVEKHQVDRGVGAFQHETKERGYATLRFKVAKESDGTAEISHWVKQFDNQEQAERFGGAAVVKEVKVGMSLTEVESALGPPTTRVDLDSKVLYKYRDMTVEFHDGKVTDVR